MDTLKERIDVRTLVQDFLGYKPQSHSSKYDVYSCPFHNESKGFSFVVYSTHAQCMGKCGKSWDCYAFVQHRLGVSFVEAKAELNKRYGGGEQLPPPNRNWKPSNTPPPLAPMSEPPSYEWQDMAWDVVLQAEQTLWGDNGGKALAYLHRRGLTDETIKKYRLGYIQGHYEAWVKVKDLSVPCGILIPHIYKSSELWGIKVRRAGGNVRYQQVAGGNIAGHLFGALDVVAGQPLIIDEGEFNAMILNQCNLDMSAVAIGSTGNKNINQRWFALIASAPVTFARMDQGSGDNALDHLKKFSRAVKPLVCPSPYKDPNDYYIGSDRDDFALWAWANSHLPITYQE